MGRVVRPMMDGASLLDTPRLRTALGATALFLLFFVPAAAWAVSSPLYSVPDEPDQAVKAVSIWYGQLAGERVDGQPSVVRSYSVPARWSTSKVPAVCYAGHPDVTPDRCDDHLLEGPLDPAQVSTYDGGFPPLYFALVGWGGRLRAGPNGVLLMRLASAALTAALLAWSVRTLERVLHRGLALAAVLAAATPMVYFLSGSVNPNGFEAAAAIAFWSHLIALVRSREQAPDEAVPVGLVVGTLVSGGLLAFTRFFSPAYVVGIVVLAILAGSPIVGTARSLWSDARVRAATIGLVAVAAVAGLLVLVEGGLTGIGSGAPLPPGTSPWLYPAGMTEAYIQEMIGWFGWLDTPPVQLYALPLLALELGLVAGAVLLARARRLVGLLATLVVTLALPIVAQAPRAAQSGLTWQGRHGLPVAVGIPLLAVLAIDREAWRIPGLVRRAARSVAVVVGFAGVVALWWNLHRYTLGLGSSSLDLAAGAWQPHLGAWTWVAVMAAWAVVAVAVAVVWTREPDPAPPRRGMTSGEPGWWARRYREPTAGRVAGVRCRRLRPSRGIPWSAPTSSTSTASGSPRRVPASST